MNKSELAIEDGRFEKASLKHAAIEAEAPLAKVSICPSGEMNNCCLPQPKWLLYYLVRSHDFWSVSNY